MDFEKVRDMIAEKMDIEAESVTLDTTFEDLQIDSIDMVEIIMDVEEAFDISIDTDQDIKCVGDLIDYIEKAKQ